MQAVIKTLYKGINIAEPEIERYASAVEQQTLAAGQGDRPLPLKLLGPGAKRRPALMGRR